MKALRALMALAVLVLLLGGVPILLLAWGDPLSLLDVSWSTAFTRPDDGTILLGFLSAVGWVAWVVLAVTTITELISSLSRTRIRIQLPGISWLQPAVGALVAMALSPVLSSHAVEPPPPPASHAPQEVEQEQVPDNAAPSAQAQVPPSREFVIQPGDELWGVAERELGDGTLWRNILAHNPGMTADTILTPGDTIRLPVAAGAARADPAAETRHITVERHDTLWDLAEEHLGDPYRWPEIHEANREQVVDPDEIDIGWQLALPTDRAEQPASTEIPELATGGSAPEAVHQPGAVDQPEAVDQPDADGRSDQEAPIPPGASDAPPPSPSVTTEFTTAPSSSPSLDVSAASPPGDPAASTVAATTREAADAAVSSSTSTATPTATNSSHVPTGNAASTSSSRSALDMLGPVGGALAASLVAGVMARRQVQLLHRSVGSRISPLGPGLQRFFAGLVQHSGTNTNDPLELSATSVVLGWDEDGDVIVDLEQERCILLTGSDELAAGMAAALLTSLLCADWSAAVEVIAVQPDQQWSGALDDPRLTSENHVEEALAHLQRLCAERRLQLGHDNLVDVRADPDRAAMWAPVVFMFCAPLPLALLDRIHDALSLGPVGVSVVAASPSPARSAPHVSVLDIESETNATLNGDGDFQPQLLNKPARHAVMSLFVSALDERTTPAPWWRDGGDTAATASPRTATGPFKDGAMSAWPTRPENPTLLLLGPVELLGTSGEPPTRAMGQCVEYCAWLLMHPESTPTTMVRELLVAETTRRSNMSRLRTWLGSDADGNPYLPDAYSGRISLAPSVTSDWERFQSLLAGGVNASSTPLLHEAMSLVRGKPLEDVAFQWPWTSQWLTDMTSMISDAATVLTDRYLTEQDYSRALWAIDQGRLATGDDETLAVRRIQVLAHAGDRAEVDGAITQLTRTARATNHDLSEDSIRRIQHALHLTMNKVSSS